MINGVIEDIQALHGTEFKKGMIEPMINRLFNSDPLARENTHQTLLALGETIVPYLGSFLSHPEISPRAQIHIVQILGELKDERALQALTLLKQELEKKLDPEDDRERVRNIIGAFKELIIYVKLAFPFLDKEKIDK